MERNDHHAVRVDERHPPRKSRPQDVGDPSRPATGRIRGWAMGALALLGCVLPLAAAPGELSGPIWMRSGHGGNVRSVSYSPDGIYVATAAEDKLIKIWRVADAVLVRTLAGHSRAVRAVAYSPSGALLASGGDDDVLRVWDPVSGEELQTITSRDGGHTASIRAVAFSPDERYLASGGDDSVVKVRDLENQEGVRSLTESAVRGIRSVAFSRDGTSIAASSQDSQVRVWSWRQPQPVARMIPKHDGGAVNSLVFSPADNSLISGGDDGTVRVWNVQTNVDTHPPLQTGEPVWSVAVSADGRTLAAGFGRAGRTVIWRPAEAAAPIYTAREVHHGLVVAVALSPDGKRLVTGGTDERALVWDAVSGAFLYPLTVLRGAVIGVAFTANDESVIPMTDAGSLSGISSWRTRDAQQGFELLDLREIPSSLAVSPDGKLLAYGGNARRVNLVGLAPLRRQAPLEGHTATVTSVAFSANGVFLVSGGNDEDVIVWKQSNGVFTRVKTLNAVENVVALAVTPNGDRIAAATDRELRLFKVETGEFLPLAGNPSRITAVAFSPDGTLLATGGFDHFVRLFRVADGAALWSSPPAHTAPVTAVAFSPDGQTLASAGGNGDETIRLFRVPGGAPVQIWARETVTGVRSLAFSRKGDLLAYGRNDSTVSLVRVAVAPQAPSGLSATTLSESEILVKWNDNSHDENGFQIERRVGSGPFEPLSPLRPAGSTEFRDTGLAPATLYTYRVRAVNAAGFSAYSNEAGATTRARPAPTAPSDLRVIRLTPFEAVLEWRDNSSDEDGFRMERSTDGVTYTDAARVGRNVTSGTVTNLIPNTRYWFRVRAFNTAGPSSAATLGPVTTPPPPVPPGRIEVTPLLLKFGAVRRGRTKTQPLTIRNVSSTGSLTMTVPQPPAPFSAQSGAGTVVLAPNSTHQVILAFTPTRKGRASGTLAITSTDPDRPSVSVSFRASGR